VLAAGVPEEYDRLALAVDLTSVWGGRPTEARLNQIAAATGVAAKRLGAGSSTARLQAKAGANRAERLEALKEELEDARATILLAAPEGATFDGKVIWDVMLCLGLRWGDMDEFHWENDEQSPGDDHLFSVFTGTAPGYFLPEQIAAGQLHVGNLVFEFSIPRSADPEVVVEGMLAAATYAQKAPWRRTGRRRRSGSPGRYPAAVREDDQRRSERGRLAGWPRDRDAGFLAEPDWSIVATRPPEAGPVLRGGKRDEK
jgi:cell division protein ZipA